MPELRSQILTDQALPNPADLTLAGREAAKTIVAGRCLFLDDYQVSSEWEYKVRRMRSGGIMRHAQIGYRSLDRSCLAYAEIYERLHQQQCPLDRYGICLDWSMGYPAAQRDRRPRGTGLILASPESFIKLTSQAPVAPHFGDFVMGMPAAFENTAAALSAGATSIGNLGQFFSFRLPEWHDDVLITAETIKAIALCAAQPVPILIHSNLDDGFAALFTDLACALGAVLLEQYIVDDLLGATISHCYGHTYSEPLARLAFQRALSQVNGTPGTMIYGNTTIYGSHATANYAGLGSYLLIDVLGQMLKPTGHAINPVPVSEAQRIPDIEEIVDAHLFAHRLIDRAGGFESLIDIKKADDAAARIIDGAKLFKTSLLQGFESGGIDIENPVEMLLAIRRLGPRLLEEKFGPGKKDSASPRGRRPVFMAATISALEKQAEACINVLHAEQKQKLDQDRLKVCIATTDVHEYGKMLVESVLSGLGINTVNGGVCTDVHDLVTRVLSENANVIAISTYNGVALDYLRRLKAELARHDLAHVPVYIGGKLNQIMDADQCLDDDLPVDVTHQLLAAGAFPCHKLEDMLLDLARQQYPAGETP